MEAATLRGKKAMGSTFNPQITQMHANHTGRPGNAKNLRETIIVFPSPDFTICVNLRDLWAVFPCRVRAFKS
jgi:hypothetical protein